MKRNKQNRGFIATAVLYSLVIIISLVLFIILKNLMTTRKIERDTGLEAKGELLYYEIDYNGNGSTTGTMEKERKPSGKNVELKACAYSRIGYSFAGWTKSASQACDYNLTGNQKCYQDKEMVRNLAPVATTLTLYAQWKANQYTVVFNPNGGTPTPSNKTVTYDSTYGTLPTVTRRGYTFKGWWTATSGGTQITSATKVNITSTQTLYARWQANNYTVTFNPNGGNTPNPRTKTVTYDGTYGSLASVSRAGYTFKGWWTATSGGTQIGTGTKVTITGNQTLYARWQANNYTVTFNANGGNTANPRTKTVTYNGTYGSLASTSRAGYTFKGWWTAPTGGTQIGTGTRYTTAGNQTLYARWQVNSYTITFNANGGSVSPGSKSVIYNGTYGSLPTPTRANYNFLGWFTAASGGTQITSSTRHNMTSGRTLYAHWQLARNPVKVLYKPGVSVYPPTPGIWAQRRYQKTGKNSGTFEDTGNCLKLTARRKKIDGEKYGANWEAVLTASTEGYKYIYIIGNGGKFSSGIEVNGSKITGGCDPENENNMYSAYIGGGSTFTLRVYAYSDYGKDTECNGGIGGVNMYRIVLSDNQLSKSQVSSY